MSEKIKTRLSDLPFGLTAAGTAFSYALAFAGCLSLNICTALVCTVISLAFSVRLKGRLLSPDAFLIVPLVLVASLCPVPFLSVTVLGGSLLFFLVALAASRRENTGFNSALLPDSVFLGVSVGLAFSVTALLTTYYFGIGATGATVLEMLKNYRYLGFHPNWRGVFYGTITLFAMITFPFKFKKLSQYLPAEVVSLIIPFVLNLFLNPNPETTPILELGTLADIKSISALGDLLPISGITVISGEQLLTVLKGTLSVAVILFFLTENKSQALPMLGANAVSGVLGGFPSIPKKIKSYNILSAAVAVLAVTALAFMPSLVARVPLHSLSVVLIVSAWKRVKFGRFPSMLRKEKLFGAFSFAVSVASFVVFDVSKALVICLVLAALSASGGRKAK